MVKRATLFINGDLARLPQLRLRKKDFLIGVDGGTRLARKLGLKLDLIIGDFDSLPRPTKGNVIYKVSQELTDTEFALEYCLKHGYKDVVLVGILGSRLDHFLANIFLGYRFNLTIIEGKQTLYFVSSKINLAGKKGDLISLIPLSDCLGVTTEGLEWPLQGETLKVGTSRGISNVMTGKSARVSLEKGRLLVVYNSL
jgi:thiamine pyrophosphokinase